MNETIVYKTMQKERLFDALYARLKMGYCKEKACPVYRFELGPKMDKEECKRCVDDR